MSEDGRILPRSLYRKVILDNYRILVAVGLCIFKADVILLLYQEREPWTYKERHPEVRAQSSGQLVWSCARKPAEPEQRARQETGLSHRFYCSFCWGSCPDFPP
ncbi:protein ZNF738-like [Peromyscus leucopus]|uniref:protein ZNF738-like n=1 Tax=Peromyscus leucopus TaxID=10041 RepID=UPI0018859AFF|nr:protein ZNF738-like [Peromyscus leucopus]